MRKLSVIIPVYNEESTLAALVEEIARSVPEHITLAEILFVDDGSTDGSFELLRSLSEQHSYVRAIRLPVNRGKADALDIGFRHAEGDIVITMDADLQDDPEEIPRFIEKLDEGYDLVSGWKQRRQDPWHKTWLSRIFNFVISRLFNLPLHDFNCGFKAYRSTLSKRLYVYGELHRYIPVIAKYMGAKITDIPVNHHPRKFGHSKYGSARILKGFLDMITVLVTTRFLKRPLHFFGSIGFACAFVGGLMLTYLACIWLGGARPIGNRPLLFYGIALLIVGVQILSMGVVAELFIRFNHRMIKPIIAEKIGFRKKRETTFED